jgi:hypothetical protein
MLRILAVAALLVACSKSHDSQPTGARRVPVISDALLDRLGPADMIIAVDLGHFNMKGLLAQIPDEGTCIREALEATGVVVLAIGKDTVGYVATPEDKVTSCVKQFAAFLDVAVNPIPNGFELAIPDQPVTATWKDGTATIVETGHAPPKGEPDAELLGLLAKVPRDAKGLIVQHAEPKHVIKTLVGWLKTSDTTFELTLVFEGFEPGRAHETVTQVIAGFKSGASQKGLTLDDKWFQIKDDGLKATMIATVPYDFAR